MKEEEEEEEEVEGEAKFQCKICLEDKSARAFYNLSQCNHQYCKSVSFFLTLSHLSLSPPSHPLTPRYFPLRLPSILLPSPFFSFFVFCQYPFSSKSIDSTTLIPIMTLLQRSCPIFPELFLSLLFFPLKYSK